jgi:hypothetical protein
MALVEEAEEMGTGGEELLNPLLCNGIPTGAENAHFRHPLYLLAIIYTVYLV